MSVMECPEDGCEDRIVKCDNNVYLDFPAVPYDERDAGWTIMPLGPMHIASVGNPSPLGTGHSLHKHQPDES